MKALGGVCCNMLNILKRHHTIAKAMIGLLIANCLSACIGSPVASYKTDVQKFSWGKAYVWMSKAAGSRVGDTEGLGDLHINFTFKRNVMKKGCVITVLQVYLEDSNTRTVLIDGVPTYSDSSPLSLEIKEYDRKQLSIFGFPFEYEQSSFPYDVEIDMSFDCKGVETSHALSKQLKFRMVQPVIWEQ